ncbi:hypothetical protein IWW50_000951 [Coemansia erecta]|nr:hypothetical protein IWW50_000951 [Coemansia erecta]
MVELEVSTNQTGNQCLVYKNRGSRVEGKVVLRTSDRLKLRQISVRLISTELVDFHNKNNSNGGNNGGNSSSIAGSIASSIGGYGSKLGSSSSSSGNNNGNGGSSNSGGLHSYLQKSSKTVGTWMILEKKASAHVLPAGKHHYSIEIPLPKGLDGTVESKTYSLQYQLETQLEYSFKLKPDLVTLTPLELVQVPMASNLQSDDRISLKVIPGRQPVAGMRMSATDVPLGRALCLEPDVITQTECFVLHHLWEDVLSLRLRLPFGRVLPAAESPVLDIEAVPLARNHRCTAFRVVLEEISIIARPQRVGILNTRPRVASGDAGASNNSLQPQDGQAPARRESVAVSHMSSSSEDSLPLSSHNAWAYAQECSSAYDNAITRVRELSSASAKWPQGQYPTLGAYHGILANKLNLSIPRAAKDDTHADVRNSHIQVHHQLVYELEYRVVGSEMVDLLQKEPRVRAAAHIYNNLGSANIVRRDEIRDDRRPGPTYTVRGTLPVAIVSSKIANMWGIRNTSQDPQTEPSAVAAAISESQAEFPDIAAGVPAYSTLSMPRLAMPDHSLGRRLSTDSAATSSHHHSHSGVSTPHASTSPYPPLQPPPAGFAGGSPFGMPESSAYSMMPNSALSMPQIPIIQEPCPSSSRNNNNNTRAPYLGDAGIGASQAPYLGNVENGPALPSSSSLLSLQQQPQQQQSANASIADVYATQPATANATATDQPAYDTTAIQRQIELFQEQQRQQQEQFFKQLSQQYAQMDVGQPGSLSLPPALSAMLSAGSSTALPPQPPLQPLMHNAGSSAVGAETISPVSQSSFLQVPTTSSQETSNASDIYAVLQVPRLQNTLERTESTNSVVSSEHSASTSSVRTVEDTMPAQSEPTLVASSLPDIATASAPTIAPSENYSVAVQASERPGSAVAANSTSNINSNSSSASRRTGASNAQPPAGRANGRSSPPPSYDDLLPPEYEVPNQQPPPYRPLNRRTGNGRS